MKISRYTLYRIFLAVLAIVSIALSFAVFSVRNRDRIEEQNEEYIDELTAQGAKSVDSLLRENLAFIRSTSFLYGNSLTSSAPDVEVLRNYEENTSFEMLRFIDVNGDDYTSSGMMANLSDRDYFRAGMEGHSGITFVARSRVTGERQIGFYAPVYHASETAGIMIGFYGEDYIRSILEFSLFGFDGESWLCTADGDVIGSTAKEIPDNFISRLEEEELRTPEELARIQHTLSEEGHVSFSYPEQGHNNIVCGISLTNADWVLYRSFPASANQQLQDQALRSGERLLFALLLILLAIGILAVLNLMRETAAQKKTIQNTERDPLTGLYNRQYFYHYVEIFDRRHKNVSMDAVLIDADNFRSVNERYGRAYGDDVLKRVAQKLLEAVKMTDGVLCRRDADVFMLYCPHRSDYRDLLELASVVIDENDPHSHRVRLRMGIYTNVDKNIEIFRRFDMAKSAATTIRGNFKKQIAYYDNTLHEKELFEEQLIEDFNEALENRQFLVYLQPKFDIRPDEPFVAEAEALVRWEHPELGLLSPGEFMPLFEKNGLIGQLDNYVWRETASLLKSWKQRFGKVIPVSVNLSRVDMYDPTLAESFSLLLKEFGLTAEEFLLEITESAYMEDTEYIIKTAKSLRSLGFRLEMDDFGTGYSSLGMLSHLPVDVLKLDMSFIKDAFGKERDLRMIELIINIADHLNVPIVAEGVETEEQYRVLRELGCSMIQGYYFSRPVRPEVFEQYLNE